MGSNPTRRASPTLSHHELTEQEPDIPTPATIEQHALAAADMGLPVFPLAPLSKKPLLKASDGEGWDIIATTDPLQIQRWFREHPRMNYGIACGDESDLFVVDIDNDEAATFWKSKGFASAAVVRTPGGGFHDYWRTEGADIQTNQSAIFPGIDIRGSGGYVVGPGSMLPTGTYAGDIRNIPMAPDELLAIIPERQTYVSVVREGEKVDAASPNEQRQIEWVVSTLEALPREWVEGAGWRSTFYRCACLFSRMVNSPDYAMTEDGALGILLAACPTDDAWGEREQMEQWASARRSTAGQYADVPTDKLPNLLPFLDVANLLPDYTTTGESFTHLVFELDPDMDPWRVRRTILVEAFRAGLSPEQAVSVTWGSRPAAELQTAPGGLGKLWKEAETARASVAAEQGADFEAPTAEARPALKVARIELLTAAERATVAADDKWFGARYVAWIKTKVSAYNASYHRMYAWLIMSLVFSDAGFMPGTARPIAPILYSFQVGPTTSGKSEAMGLFRSVVRACFPGDNPVISANASENALVEHLIERDGKPTIMVAEEAKGVLQMMSTPGHWMAGLKDQLLALFDGIVAMILRSGKKDVSGKEATSFFSLNFISTVDGMADALNEEFWVSGFGPRSIWAVGESLNDPDADVAREADGYGPGHYDEMPKQWAAEFAAKRQELKAHGILPLAVKSDKESLDRQTKVQKQLTGLAKGHRLEHLLKPTFIRLGMTIRKAAVLVAMSEGSPVVTLRHRLIAIEAGEEWVNNIMFMVERTTSNGHRRQVDELERFVASQPGRRVRMEKVYAHSNDRIRFVDERVEQLVKEGRVTKMPVPGKDAHELVLKEAA